MKYTIKNIFFILIGFIIVILLGFYIYFNYYFDFNLTTKRNIIFYQCTDSSLITVNEIESPISINSLEVIISRNNKPCDTLIHQIRNEEVIGIIEQDSMIFILLKTKGLIDSLKIKKQTF